MKTNSGPISSNDTEELVWAMLDEQLSPDEFRRLESLLLVDEDARRLYLQCVQLHIDLQCWFRDKDDRDRNRPLGLPLDLPLAAGDASLADPAF
jgi:hypothetical protein